MIDLNNLPDELVSILKSRFKDKLNDLKIPPTAFTTMGGQLIEYNIDKGYLKTKFPVLKGFLNQFGNMQGGMIAAAIDNTLGPLSMLVAPPNFTRQLEIKYKKPVHPDIGYIFVSAQLVERRERQLLFTASVEDNIKSILVTAKAIHWILDVTDDE